LPDAYRECPEALIRPSRGHLVPPLDLAGRRP
jgi:hypothetical protein